MTNDENIAFIKKLLDDKRFVVQMSVTTDDAEATGYTAIVLDKETNKTLVVHEVTDWPRIRAAAVQESKHEQRIHDAIAQAFQAAGMEMPPELTSPQPNPPAFDITNYDLVIFDLDGTLVVPIVGDKKTGHFPAHAHDWKLLPGRYETIRILHEHVQLAICTNQGGVAFNIAHANDVKRAVDDVGYLLGIYLTYVCFDHPKGRNPKWAYESTMRKPNPGMLLRAIEDAHTDADCTLFVGDRDEDQQAAHNAGCDFMRADQFFALLAGVSPAEAAPVEDHPF